MASLLVMIWWVACVWAISLLTTPNVKWETFIPATRLYYTWIDNRNEVVNHAYFVDSEDQSDVINEMFVEKNNGKLNFNIRWNSVVLQWYGTDNETPVFNNNTVWEGEYANILWWNKNVVDSSNIVIIGWESNNLSGWNDNATILWSKESAVYEWNGGIPLVLLWWVNNKIWEKQNGAVILWGRNNIIAREVKNSQILWWENNTISADNATVAWSNVSNGVASDSFVFSDWRSSFSPETSNSFYLNVANGLWLNTEASNGWVSSKWIVSVWELVEGTCNADNVWLQWLLSGCLVGCAKGWEWELLDTSERCYELLDEPYVVPEPEEEPGYCYDGWVDTSNSTICWTPESYINTRFKTKLIDSKVNPYGLDSWIYCPTDKDNQCVYQCNDGWHLVDGKCYKDCSLDGIKIKHNESAVWYNTTSTTCTDTCTAHSKTLTCNDGNLNEGAYVHANCTLNKYRCDTTEYPLSYSDVESSKWHYSSCTDYDPVGNYQCNDLTPVHWKLDYCYSDYTRVWNKCYEKCSFNWWDHNVDHWDDRVFYLTSSETCTDTCSSALRTCSNGSWIWYSSYQKASCSLYDKTCAWYTLSESDKQEWKNYTSCVKYSANGNLSCTKWDEVWKEWEGCAAGYWECGWDCKANCGEWKHPDTNSCSCVDDVVPEDWECGVSNNVCDAWTYKDTPDTETEYKWECDWINWWSDDYCSITKEPTLWEDWKCGEEVDTCEAWKYEDVTDTSTEYKWKCKWINWWDDKSCSKTKTPVEIPYCGTATQSPSLSSPTNLCSWGTASTPVEDMWEWLSQFPIWKWTCSTPGNSTDCWTYIPTATVDAESCGSSWSIDFGTNPYDLHWFDGITMNVSVRYHCSDNRSVYNDTIYIDYYGANGWIWQAPSMLGWCGDNWSNYVIDSA